MEKYHFCSYCKRAGVKSPIAKFHPYWLQKLVEKIKLEINNTFFNFKIKDNGNSEINFKKKQIQYKDISIWIWNLTLFYFRTANRLLLLRLSWLLVQSFSSRHRGICPAGVSTCNFLFSILGSY
jgi:hypothetical protein